VKWLDLACGEGQNLTSLAQGFDEYARKKIEYTRFDRLDTYLRATEKIASSVGACQIQNAGGQSVRTWSELFARSVL
jgi:hypothetical protein